MYHEILLRNKKEQIIDTFYFLDASLHTVLREESQYFQYIYIVSICITFLKWQNDENGDKIHCCQGWGTWAEEVEGEVDAVTREGKLKNTCGDGTVLYLDYGADNTNLPRNICKTDEV